LVSADIANTRLNEAIRNIMTPAKVIHPGRFLSGIVTPPYYDYEMDTDYASCHKLIIQR